MRAGRPGTCASTREAFAERRSRISADPRRGPRPSILPRSWRRKGDEPGTRRSSSASHQVITDRIGTKRRFSKCGGDEKRGGLAAIVITLEEGRGGLSAAGNRLCKLIVMAGRREQRARRDDPSQEDGHSKPPTQKVAATPESRNAQMSKSRSIHARLRSEAPAGGPQCLRSRPGRAKRLPRARAQRRHGMRVGAPGRGRVRGPAPTRRGRAARQRRDMKMRRKNMNRFRS